MALPVLLEVILIKSDLTLTYLLEIIIMESKNLTWQKIA
jgi:hypothetical protein